MSEFVHVPLLYDSFFDPFSDNLWDFTFPPRRYAVTQGHEHGNRHRDRRIAQRGKDDGSFKVSLHVGHYKPEEITLKVDDGTLCVTGKHFNEGEHGFESSEFQRTYVLPEDTDADSLKSRITGDGVLQIEASKKQIAETEAEDSSKEFKVSVPTSGFKPENISVKLNERNLTIQAEEKEEGDSHYHCKQLTRQFTLPKDVDATLLKTELMKDGTLVVKAPRNPALLPQERVLPIEHAKGSEME